MVTVSSKPFVVMSPSLGPVLWIRVFVGMVVEYLIISALPRSSLRSNPNSLAASLTAVRKPMERL